MDQQTTSVPIQIGAADLAELEEWARNSERSVAELLEEALRHYLEYTRADIADLQERAKGPSYSLDEVKAHLAELRQNLRRQAAE